MKYNSVTYCKICNDHSLLRHARLANIPSSVTCCEKLKFFDAFFFKIILATSRAFTGLSTGHLVRLHTLRFSLVSNRRGDSLRTAVVCSVPRSKHDQIQSIKKKNSSVRRTNSAGAINSADGGIDFT